MSLQFVFGNSGSGKSHYIRSKITEESIVHPEKNYLVIVPEQFTMQTQKDLVMANPKKGILNIDVLSFVRLAHRVFEEIGCERTNVLDDEGKSLILRRIAGGCNDELTVLKGNIKKPGYISEVKSVISEFTQYGIGREEMDRLLEEVEPESYLYYKLKDIQVLHERFYEFLEHRYITKEELLELLSQVAVKSEMLKDSVVVLDGFTGFTPVQEHLLRELLLVCEKVIITVEMDQREDPYVYKHPYQLFALSKQMVTGLLEICREHQITVEEPVCLYDRPVHRFQSNEPLAVLESRLFRRRERGYEQKQDVIEIHSAPNQKEEVRFAAQEIRRLVRTCGYRYREIAVIAGDLSLYADELERMFSQYDIPVFTDHKRSILLNSFVEYLRSLIAMAEQNFSYDSVFRYLRSGMTDFTFEEIDRLENYVRAMGIRGYKRWTEVWVRRGEEMDADQLDEMNGLRCKLTEPMDHVMYILKKNKKTVREMTEALYEFLVQEQIYSRLTAMEERFKSEGKLTLAKEYSQIYGIVIDLFDKFIELLGEEQVSMKEYCDLLDAGLQEAKVGVIPPSLDQVVAGDIQRTRLENVKALFLLGVNDTLIPGTANRGGLLSQRDRDRIQKEKFALSPGAKEQNYIQKFYLYMILTKPSEKLYLTYARSSTEGSALRPAYLIADIQRIFPALTVREESVQDLKGMELTPDTGVEYVVRGLQNKSHGFSQEWKELYTWYRKNPEWCRRIEKLVKANFYHKNPQWISELAAKQLYGEQQTPSVTRLEKFAACAYAHFLSYGLHLKERKEYQFEAMDLGVIAHKSIELYAGKLRKEKLDWQDVSVEQQKELVSEAVRESISGYGNTVLYSTARNEYMITRISRLLERSVWALTRQLSKGRFRPQEYELNFGSGQIDRIDTCETEEKLYVKVVDYKTGSKSFDITSLYHGLQMQLVVYLNAAVEYEKKQKPDKHVIPAGVFYYQMKDPLVEKPVSVSGKSTKSDAELDAFRSQVEEELMKELRPSGLINASEETVNLLDQGLEGESEVIPVKKKKDGSLSQTSNALSEEEFWIMMEYTKELVNRMKGEMLSGDTRLSPYELGSRTGCDYCQYRDICGFDVGIPGCEYRRLSKYDKAEVLEKMKEDQASWE